jgi:hypothetical protein
VVVAALLILRGPMTVDCLGCLMQPFLISSTVLNRFGREILHRVVRGIPEGLKQSRRHKGGNIVLAETKNDGSLLTVKTARQPVAAKYLFRVRHGMGDLEATQGPRAVLRLRALG